MGIRQTLEQISTSLNSAYTSIGNKGGIVPTDKTLSNLPDSINSIELIADYEEDLESLLGKCVDSISITGDWTNTQYAGTPVDYTGLVFTATYNDGTTASVTPTSISPSVWGSTEGEQTCTFTYEENGFSVSASKNASVVPSAQPTITYDISAGAGIASGYGTIIKFSTIAQGVEEYSVSTPYFGNSDSIQIVTTATTIYFWTTSGNCSIYRIDRTSGDGTCTSTISSGSGVLEVSGTTVNSVFSVQFRTEGED